MDWLQTTIIGLILFLGGLYFKNMLPSYFDEKGKNLATKEDIAEITRKTEEVQNEFREGFELFSSDVRFKYDFSYKRYSELYCSLYAIVMQSEYLRHFFDIDMGKYFAFEEVPFLQISPITKITHKVEFGENGPTGMSAKREEFETPLSQYNKMKLCDSIIEHSDLASPKLLKIAMAYRFVHNNYDGRGDGEKTSATETANDEELRLIREMVTCIVMEYNGLRKDLKMDFNQTELDTGIPQFDI